MLHDTMTLLQTVKHGLNEGMINTTVAQKVDEERHSPAEAVNLKTKVDDLFDDIFESPTSAATSQKRVSQPQTQQTQAQQWNPGDMAQRIQLMEVGLAELLRTSQWTLFDRQQDEKSIQLQHAEVELSEVQRRVAALSTSNHELQQKIIGLESSKKDLADQLAQAAQQARTAVVLQSELSGALTSRTETERRLRVAQQEIETRAKELQAIRNQLNELSHNCQLETKARNRAEDEVTALQRALNTLELQQHHQQAPARRRPTSSSTTVTNSGGLNELTVAVRTG